MQYEEQIPRKPVTKRDMLKRVARFSKIRGSDGGLPDSHHPSAERILYNVIGFQPPSDEGETVFSPVGDKAARMSAIKISEGFNLGFCRALPGKGPMMHNHDTNETFIGITGTWRASWEDPQGKVQFVDLAPLDVISFPPGVIRRFENVTKGPKNKYSTLMFVIAGDGPAAEFSSEAMAELAQAGLLDAHLRARGKTYSTDSAAPAPKPLAAKRAAPKQSAAKKVVAKKPASKRAPATKVPMKRAAPPKAVRKAGRKAA